MVLSERWVWSFWKGAMNKKVQKLGRNGVHKALCFKEFPDSTNMLDLEVSYETFQERLD